MSKKLLIAEKPSVATDLATVLGKKTGKFEKKKDYFENDSLIISSAVGHLVELGKPTSADGKKIGWGFKHLPILPEKFELQAVEKSQPRLKLLIKLMKRKDIDEIINACDAGREGELIFRYVLAISKVKKNSKRLWLQSMTQGAILEAWQNLRENEEMLPLADAAQCRSESDWLVGMNATRALTAYRSRNGGFNLTPAGRVQTPTLAILAARESEIENFVPEAYHEVHADFGVTAGTYAGRWFDPQFKAKGAAEHRRAERIWEAATAQEIVDRCRNKEGDIEETKKPQKQAPPLLFDLTSLQREAGSRFGFSARNTLRLAQSLYERHKLLTYPRTDSRYLPNDYIEKVREIVKTAADGKFPIENISNHAGSIIDNKRIISSPRIFNSAKVSDHFAIIPTGKIPGKLDEPAYKLYDFVLRRFLSVFMPDATFEVTKRITRIEHNTDTVDHFRTDGKVIIQPGWQAIYGKQAGKSTGKNDLCAVTAGETAKVENIEKRDLVTKHKPRYNESTLLTAMETAGKMVDDDELAEAMSERGLGTPATRAATIEGLIQDKYIVREQRDLIVTPKGMSLIGLIREVGVDMLASPELTGDWEYKLKEMEHGNLDRDKFMSDIRQYTADMVEKTKKHTAEIAAAVFPDLPATCPKCGANPMRTTDAHYSCMTPDCDFRIGRAIAGREITPAEASELLEKKFIGPLEGFRSRFGKPFTAAIELDATFKTKFVFDNDGAGEEKEPEAISTVDLSKFGGPAESTLYDNGRAYICKDVKGDRDKTFKMSKTILKREIEPAEVISIISTGRTPLLKNFISKKGKPFNAFLVLDHKTGKVRFEFEERKFAKKKSATKSK